MVQYRSLTITPCKGSSALFDRFYSFIKRIGKISSLADQLLVSGGNFLTLAICAHALPLSEQGKFTYVFASYMALLLLNVAAIFQAAAVRAPAQKHSTYLSTLAKYQLIQALLTSLLLSAAWLGAGSALGWQATTTEAAWLFAFLVLQQLADFDRRTAYIFADTKRAILSSAALYPIRLIALIAIQPGTVSQVLMILVLSALIPATCTIFTAIRDKSADLKPWIGEVKKHLAYSRLFIAGAPLAWLWSYLPIFMLGTMHGKEQLAHEVFRHVLATDEVDAVAFGNLLIDILQSGLYVWIGNAPMFLGENQVQARDGLVHFSRRGHLGGILRVFEVVKVD